MVKIATTNIFYQHLNDLESCYDLDLLDILCASLAEGRGVGSGLTHQGHREL